MPKPVKIDLKFFHTFVKKVRLKFFLRYFRIINLGKISCFDEVITLGYNCENSFRVMNVISKKKFHHYLYSWLYVTDREKFLQSLNNPVGFVDDDFELLPWGMLMGKTTKFHFHPEEERMLRENPEKCDIDAAKANLKSKIKHLAEKTVNMLNSNKKILFIIKVSKVSVDEDIEFIKKVNDILNAKCSNKEYKLLCIFEGRRLKKDEKKFLSRNITKQIDIGFVKKFARDPQTDIGGSIYDWLKIISRVYFTR